MARQTIDFGIDLGTTNSAIAVFEGTRARVIENNDGMNYTPSVVYIDPKNNLRVGRYAKNRIEYEPEDALAEFKIQMGTNTEYKFARSGRTMRPEELSAEVLKALRADIQQRLGEDLQAAVITVPAAFELPSCQATKQAAQMAGLTNSPLIMEPTAAAMAHAFQSEVDKVFWLVYDFGGGTFDAAVIQIRDGNFRIVNHAGDNHLGGKLIDWEIVEKILAPAAAHDYKLVDFTRQNLKWRKAFAKMKYAAEEAKIRLSIDRSCPIVIDYLCNDERGEQVTFEFDLKREDIARVAEPYIQRTINITRQALTEKRLGVGDIQKIILVGGPTLAPYVREHLADQRQGLGITLDFSMNPLTVVAEGAAIFAGTQRQEGTVVTPETEAKKGVYQIELQYKPVDFDPEPMVAGRVIPQGDEDLSKFTIEFVNPDARPTWRSGKVGLAPNGSFMTNLWAERGKQHTFQINLYDGSGSLAVASPDHLTYTIGITDSAPPLIHSIGIALANNEVKRFIDKGASLPARQRRDLHTSIAIRKGDSGDLIRVPVIEGENARADRNKLIGLLEIPAQNLRRDLPVNSDVEVTIEIDASRIVKTKAYIPILGDEEFESVLNLERPEPNLELLGDEINYEKKRLKELRTKAEQNNTPETQEARSLLLTKVDGENMVDNVDSSFAAARGDRDAADKAQNRLIDLKVVLDNIEDKLAWPTLVGEARQNLENTHAIMNDIGKPEDKRQLEQLEREINQAIQNKDSDQLRRLVDELFRLTVQALSKDPGFWVGYFQYLEERKDLMRDQFQADQLFNQGRRAIDAGNVDQLQATVRQLISLLPADEQTKGPKGYGGNLS